MIVLIPGALREFTGGASEVELDPCAGTLKEALAALWTRYPGLRDRVMNEQEQVRQHINLFVGDENIRFSGGLATSVKADSVISIIPAVSGGIYGGNRLIVSAS